MALPTLGSGSTETPSSSATENNGISNGSSYNKTGNSYSTKPQMNSTTAPKVGSQSLNRTVTENDDLSTCLTHPIIALTPYQNRWIIRVRVMNKSPIRTWSNAKGEGKLFSMDLVDESGEIRATAFKEMVDKYYDMIQVDKMYYISRGQLKVANKQFSTLKNDYELTFSSDTIVQVCHDAGKIPQIQYDLIPISSIATLEPNSVVGELKINLVRYL